MQYSYKVWAERDLDDDKRELEKIYLDWVNNFLTVEKFASYYGIDEKGARFLIASLRLLFRNK